MMKPWAAASLAALCLLLAVPTSAQPSRIPTVTRLVKVFTELEVALDAHARSGDAAALDEALDPSFEMRTGARPGAPVPRDEWVRQMRASPRSSLRIEQMAVHDLGDVAIVSFRASPATASSGRARFIVDCWKRAGDGWRLAVRYASDASGGGSSAATSNIIDKRY
ncbi:MAG TPA: nuclear transport factor 2 family protein [Casimicrobiaceae bacterium]|nr:nuclear transport factor 2 family protein [Casimicrobiaceae bacterium]